MHTQIYCLLSLFISTATKSLPCFVIIQISKVSVIILIAKSSPTVTLLFSLLLYVVTRVWLLLHRTKLLQHSASLIGRALFVTKMPFLSYTVMILSFRTDMPGQTVQTQIRLLQEEQSDQGLHCLPFRLHRLDSLLFGRAT